MALHTQTMPGLDHRTIEKINDLVQLNLDCVKGFNDGADRIDDAGVASLFRELAVERQSQADELRSVAARGRVPEDSGSAIGTMHRLWMDFRAAINAGDAYVILIECERGEDRIKEAYQELLDETHGAPDTHLHEVLMRQYEQVLAAHDRIRRLRDALKQQR